MRDIGSLAGLAAKPLAEQIGDIRLVVHDQETHTHDAISGAFERGLEGMGGVLAATMPCVPALVRWMIV
jgi:hypothetical protein